MKNARTLAGEIDLWKLAWQQVETFVDRIGGAKDQDAPHARKLDALLRAARAVEHQRLLRGETAPLSDPIIDALPPGVSALQVWSASYRQWRVPGLDEGELAVHSLSTQDDKDEPVLDQVRLPPITDLFQIRVAPDDPRFAGSADGMVTLRVPSYPGAAAGTAINGSVVTVSIPEEDAVNDDDGDSATNSAFPRVRRRLATLDELDHDIAVLGWQTLCANRRSLRAAADEADVNFVGAGGGPSWQPSVDADARAVAAAARANAATVDPVGRLTAAAQAAQAAAATVDADAADLRMAAEVIAEDGAAGADLPGALTAAADTLGALPLALTRVAGAAADLASALAFPPLGYPVGASQQAQRTALANLLDQRLTAVQATLATPALFFQRIEDGPLAVDLSEAMTARIGYPDGTLRIVRTLEAALQAAWPVRVLWFQARFRRFLLPLFARFRAPFLSSLAALIAGGDTGLPVEGLVVAAQAAVGGETLITGQPVSLLPALAPIEAGHVGILELGRPTAAIVLGVQAGARTVELKVSPLRVSVASTPGLPGSPGIVAGDQPILADAAGASRHELRRGEPDAGPAGDGLVQETVSLWSKLCLLFGWLAVERALTGNATLGDSAYADRRVPDPSDSPLETLILQGEVPILATSLVIQGAPDAFWDDGVDPPEPKVARPGEMMLLRGRAEPAEGQAEGPLVQAVVEVEMAFRTTGAMLARVDTSQAGKLSTTPPAQDADGDCLLVCGPEEDVIMVVLRRSWQRSKLVGDITLRRDFQGFDEASLATGTLLPLDFLGRILPSPPAPDPGIDRHDEFRTAMDVFTSWMQYARQ
ncbi:MAG: hypothetical protein H6842_06810 [Rhodospirillaceae bacterium]|nr:hypothetical protein [Rhodospirillaceae bacterium]